MRRTSIGYKLDYDGEVYPSGQYPDRGYHFYEIIRKQRISPLLRLFQLDEVAASTSPAQANLEARFDQDA